MAPPAHAAPRDRVQPDERLLERARGGDENAFAAIVERYRPVLLRHLRPISGDGAEDAVQQAFINAWSALRRGNDVRDLRPWLFTIARRAATGTLRADNKWPEALTEALLADGSPAEHAEHTARTRDLLAAIAGLPDREREALVWTSLHGRSGREAARELGVSEDAVRALVHRARSKLRGAAGMLLPPLQEHLSVPPAPDAVTPVARAIAVLVAGAIIATPLTVLHHHSRGERDLAQSAPTAALVQPPLGGTDWSSRCCMRNSRAVPGSRHVSAPRLRADVRAGAGSPSGVSPTERSALSSGSAGALRGGGGGTVGGSGTEDSSGDPTEPTLNAGGALAPVGEAVGGVASTTDSLRNEVASRVPDAPGVVAGAVSSAEEVAGSLSGALPAQLP